MIMLVEDSADDEELTIRALRSHRLAGEIVVARDGQEALDLLLGAGGMAERGELPQVIMLDLRLPKVGGLDVLRAIRADTRSTRVPVVVLTSSDEDADLGNAYAMGANSYVKKPVDFEAFAQAVGQLGMYWLTVNLTPPPPTPSATLR